MAVNLGASSALQSRGGSYQVVLMPMWHANDDAAHWPHQAGKGNPGKPVPDAVADGFTARLFRVLGRAVDE